MSPIAGLERRPREVGRIRIGIYDEVARHPTKLDKFRLTTPNRHVAEAAAELWGGEVQPWQSAPTEGEQWEVITATSEIRVLVPPQQIADSRYYELWTKGGCQRRCDGQLELLTGGACICDEEGEMVCSPVVHLLVIIPSLPDVGVWRLTSRGFNAAKELVGTLDILQMLVGLEHVPSAILAIETRTSVANGETHHYVVPVLRSEVPLQDLGALDGGRYQLPSTAAVVDNEPEARAIAEPEATETTKPGGEGTGVVGATVEDPDDPSGAAASSGDESAEQPDGDRGSNPEQPEGSPTTVSPPSGAAVDAEKAAAPDTSSGGEGSRPTATQAAALPPDPDADKPATDEQWNRAARLYGSRLRALNAAAKLLKRSVTEADVTRAQMVKVIEAHKPGGTK